MSLMPGDGLTEAHAFALVPQAVGLWHIRPGSGQVQMYVDTAENPPSFCFGKFNGQRLRDVTVRTSYLEWMLKDLDLASDEKSAVENELRRRGPRPSTNSSGTNYREYSDSSGYKATPTERVPSTVTPATILEIVTAGRQALAKRHHPDAGGSHEKMVAINATADFLETQARNLAGASA